jgi:hypothetical protein
MGPDATRSAKFTYEDFVNFPNDGKRHLTRVAELAAEHRDTLTTPLLSGWTAALEDVFRCG